MDVTENNGIIKIKAPRRTYAGLERKLYSNDIRILDAGQHPMDSRIFVFVTSQCVEQIYYAQRI
jgi:hypothetical protein